MSLTDLCVRRPVGTTLLTLGVTLLGAVAFRLLPVAPLPQVDFPTISVSASLPGASPDTMAATVAAPLERTLGRIAGVSEITSQSTQGSTRVTLQFDLDRDIDGAARDVQAGINAARALLPTGLPSNPTWRKVNPADAPILIMALTSPTMGPGQMYDAASTILAQKLSQVDGVGQVTVGGSSLPAVRVELDPPALDRLGVGVEQVRAAIAATNVNRPKGSLESTDTHWQIRANDQARTAADYLPLIVSYANGAPVRLRDVASVVDSVQDLRNAGFSGNQPAVLLILYKQPNANVVATVDRVRALLPQLRASIPQAIELRVTMDRTPTIRASLKEVEHALMAAVALVVLVTFLFLGDWRAALVPTVAVPVSLIGTFAVMRLAGFSLDTLSLMALTIAAGFVVDDAVVVLENVSRRIERGQTPLAAALDGAREVSFTVVSMSVSLVAVFIPLLLMGGIVGRLFREFAATLSAAVLVSLAVSLTTTPMMCAVLLRPRGERPHGRFRRGVDRGFAALTRGYGRSLDVVLAHPLLTVLALAATVALNVWLYTIVPKSFFPQQDTGRLMGFVQADQSISFQAMRDKMLQFVEIVRRDPAVDSVVAFTGGGQRNGGAMFASLVPPAERGQTVDQVIGRLRGKLSHVPGASLYMVAAQDIRVGGRQGSGQYQYTLQADDIEDLREWEPRIRRALSQRPELADINTDQQDKGVQTSLVVDRDAVSRLGLSQQLINATLNDLFGQRLVSTIYNPLNQYRVVMEAAPQYSQSPQALADVHVVTSAGARVPLSAFSHWETTATPLSVSHEGMFPATTVSFNLAAGVSLSKGTAAIEDTMRAIGVPSTVQGGFAGTARAFQASLSSQPWLILAALVTIYIVLGILYESWVHPITILSTLPSAGVGAILALLATGIDFSLIALIGVILLIGIVKKNAIMMIDFAVVAARERGLDAREAIREACLVRLRPILMTTLAAMLGALPLVVGSGYGAELRRPLGVSIVGGLVVSQLLTLYTTPVVFIWMDRAGAAGRRWTQRIGARWRRAGASA